MRNNAMNQEELHLRETFASSSVPAAVAVTAAKTERGVYKARNDAEYVG